MGHTTVKSRVSTPLYIGYRCSKCNHLNLGVANIEEMRETVRHGVVLREKTRDEMANTATDFAKEALGQRTARIMEEYKKGVFRAAELNYSCANCGHKEAWSKMRYSKIEEKLGMPFLLAGIVALLFLFDKSFLEFGLIVLGMSIWFLFKSFHRSYMEKCIAKLPKHSLPAISLSKNGLISQMNLQSVDDKKEVSHSKSLSSQDDQVHFCKKCGKKVEEDSVFCSSCGTKLH